MFGLMASLLFIASASAQVSARQASCRGLLDFIYKELTLQNMDRSVKRLNYKMVLALAQVMENVDKNRTNLRRNPEVLSLIESMADIDASLGPWLEKSSQHRSYRFWNFLPFNSSNYNKFSYSDIIEKWKRLQSQRPNLFSGLEKKHLLDAWDLKTSTLLGNYSELQIADHDLKSDLDNLASRYAKNLKEFEGGFETPDLTLRRTKDLVDKLHESFNREAGKLLASSLTDHKDACSKEELDMYLSSENLACPIVPPESAADQFSGQLEALAEIVGAQLINTAAPPGPRKDKLEILEFDYKNVNYEGNFCERSPKMVDTVVIHHSGTDNKDTPQDIHDTQVVMHENDRDSSGRPDPWYMIAYNYVISSPYENGTGETKIFRGRPDKMKGAHAGAFLNLDQVDAEAKKALLKGPINCGHNSDQDPSHTLDNISSEATALTQSQINAGYVSANITSVGVLVTGNYAPDILGGRPNPSGYPSYGPVRYPTEAALKSSARLICELRGSDYPNLNKITDHNWIKIKKAVADGRRGSGTCCPGTVYKRMGNLLELARQECPEYEFELDISPKDRVCDFLK